QAGKTVLLLQQGSRRSPVDLLQIIRQPVDPVFFLPSISLKQEKNSRRSGKRKTDGTCRQPSRSPFPRSRSPKRRKGRSKIRRLISIAGKEISPAILS